MARSCVLVPFFPGQSGSSAHSARGRRPAQEPAPIAACSSRSSSSTRSRCWRPVGIAAHAPKFERPTSRRATSPTAMCGASSAASRADLSHRVRPATPYSTPRCTPPSAAPTPPSSAIAASASECAHTDDGARPTGRASPHPLTTTCRRDGCLSPFLGTGFSHHGKQVPTPVRAPRTSHLAVWEAETAPSCQRTCSSRSRTQ